MPDCEDAMLAGRHNGTPKKTGALRFKYGSTEMFNFPLVQQTKF